MIVLADAAKRSRAVDPRKSFHLEAPAGSGKTFLLTARFLRLLGLVAHPQQILALTFTNKAAAEMRERVRGYLDRAKRREEAKNEADAELLGYASRALDVHKIFEELLLAGEVLRIQTFHSFCYAVASQAPLEAGISPGSMLMDGSEQEFFLRETIGEALQEIAKRREGDAARQALMNRLLYLNNSWWLLANEMEDLVKRREGLVELVHVLGRDKATGYLSSRVRELVETELNALRIEFEKCSIGARWARFLKEIGDSGASAACNLPASIPEPKWESLPQWICIADTFLTAGGGVRKQFGPKTGFYSGFAKTEWGEAIQCIPPAAVERLVRIRELPAHDAPVRDPDTLWDLVLLLHSVLEIYDSRRAARRILDFSALEMAALRLFDATDPSDLQLVLDQRIRHILVDEFQDTSRQQWELLQKLCAGWSDADGRTLFLVGDPKQSIYGFRKAEVKLFMDAREGIPIESGGRVMLEPLILDTNFRSQPHLIDWCNRIFSRTVMAEHKPEYDEVPFSPAVVSPTTAVHADPALPELALFLEWPDREAARVREAEWLAGRIAQSLDKNGRDSQAAILLFSRTHLPVYLEALQRRKIPVQVKEGLKLSERPEVRHLWLLSRGIVLPQDDLAWAAQLRSPWLHIDLDRFHAISREEGLWIEKIRSFSEKDVEIRRFWEALGAARQHVGHEPLRDVIESAWLDLEGARIISSRWGSRGINCCRRFLDMLGEAEAGEPVQTLERLEQLLENAYEPVDPDTASSNVSLYTVHSAKGLEFDSVFIPFLDWNPVTGKKGRLPPYMLERLPGSGDYLLAPRPDRLGGQEDPLYKMLGKLNTMRRMGESKRLFYVAVTRARHELVISGAVKMTKEGFSAAGKSPLGWLNSHYGIDELAGLCDIRCSEEAGTIDEEWKKSLQTGDGTFSVLVEPDQGSGAALPVESVTVELSPAEFKREKPAFRVVSPSSLTIFDREAGHEVLQPRETPLDCAPNLWGTLVHRLFAEYGDTGRLPAVERACTPLRQAGIDKDKSLEIAARALQEVRSCLADPWLQAFYSVPSALRKVEWPLECVHEGGMIFSGIIDLAAQIGGEWKLVDFKTSSPAAGETIEDFRSKEIELYRPQLAAYREMWAKYIGLQPGSVEAFIYWTAQRKASANLLPADTVVSIFTN
ncbi:MAG: UvrD-helicase domain-containing protein [Syntrophobacteraceae bacterium]